MMPVHRQPSVSVYGSCTAALIRISQLSIGYEDVRRASGRANGNLLVEGVWGTPQQYTSTCDSQAVDPRGPCAANVCPNAVQHTDHHSCGTSLLPSPRQTFCTFHIVGPGGMDRSPARSDGGEQSRKRFRAAADGSTEQAAGASASSKEGASAAATVSVSASASGGGGPPPLVAAVASDEAPFFLLVLPQFRTHHFSLGFVASSGGV